ncbi:Deoxyribose-phosphate aldolase 2 [Pontiella desulfatans]|uniref:Deoxyribose-phosphate aldolase n=1 Tax=Pontiella desulfatans TaxID=2750659 RepID=A0A6C2U252_PONDE|nr:deoxyribose-phosphate aldolase [Pontiella desulfatans]VGO13869.1 Deoxyribose-phosphate aldolase 2 [Pontiella desulfatans]
MSLSAKEIARMIDLSCVRADSSLDEIREMAETAKRYGCICVFALPAHTPLLIDLVADRDDILVGGTVGFPDGGATTAGKVAEAIELREMGCNELDMVINIPWLKAGAFDRVAADISAVVDAADGLPVKVIMECHHLTDGELVKGCQIAADCGVRFVKTGTGWAETGATLANTALMKKTVGDRCQVKAAGGVRDLATLLEMVELGVTRFGIGVRTAVSILNELEAGVPSEGNRGAY